MRWSRLFADLESQVDALFADEVAAEIAERTRIETARLPLLDRLRAAQNHPIEVQVLGGGAVRGRVTRLGADWLLLTEPQGGEAVVPTAAIQYVLGLSRAATPAPEDQLSHRLGLRQALRGLARDRSPIRLGLIDGSVVTGTVDRVGADFLDLAEHAVGEPRRPAAVTRELTVRLRGIAVVRRS